VYSADYMQTEINNQRSQTVESVVTKTVVSNTKQQGVNFVNSITAHIDRERSAYVKSAGMNTETLNPKHKNVSFIDSITDHMNNQKG
jgi:hypothetical protein